MTRVILHGAGRMSAAIVQAAKNQPNLEIGAVVSPRQPRWDSSPPWFSELGQADSSVDVLIDFSLPDGTVTAADWCRDSGVALLSGVTGLHQRAMNSLQQAESKVAVMWSANLSIGINLMNYLCARAAAVVGPDADIRIEDIHHQWKKDAPSGTALMLGQTMAGSDASLVENIEYQSVREGEVIGRHDVSFQLAGESLKLTHEAQDRGIYARGAIKAAYWLGQQAPGRYTSADCLSLNLFPEERN
jgi:4-hydroxy-tetrahydrodipicolinate reductase